jgi:hypothetical protein
VHHVTRGFAVLGSSFLLVLGFATAAGAGAAPIGAAPLTIVKTVSGATPPTTTTFTATVSCGASIIDTGGGSSDTATVMFDSTGQPTSADTITFVGPGTCTVSETADGGAASTTYACVGTEPPVQPGTEKGFSAQQVEPGPICPAAGPQAAPITVNIEFENQQATVTIANTFVAPPTTTITPPTTPPVQAAPQVVAQPVFTG